MEPPWVLECVDETIVEGRRGAATDELPSDSSDDEAEEEAVEQTVKGGSRGGDGGGDGGGGLLGGVSVEATSGEQCEAKHTEEYHDS
jgi:hypothetical protein